MRRPPLVLSLSLTVVLSACHFSKSDHPDACRKDSDCDGDAHCAASGFCAPNEDGGKSDKPKDGGGGGTKDGGGPVGEPCMDGDPPMDCYDGPRETEDVGPCRGGQRVCAAGRYTQCVAQIVPGTETCNGKDDDCDGNTDEIQMGECETQMPGVCNAGALACRGMYAVCEPVMLAVDEECNGKDDDCDDKTDEMMSDVDCYVEGEKGCKVGSDGIFTCIGLCKAGRQGCESGRSTCAGAKTPVDEACTKGDAIAADENCDGRIDEGCSCTTGATRPCYSGPAGTEGEGTCHKGTQTCVASEWGGECEGEVVSEPETCDNPDQDNDCDGTKDDVPMVGEDCINDETHGICRPGTWQCAGQGEVSCVSEQEPRTELCDKIDQDCDGDPINGFDLSTDNDNCGDCGERCDTRDESCCAAQCTKLEEFAEDPGNCGSCGHVCEADQFCCQAKCVGVDLDPGGPGPSVDNLCDCGDTCQDGEVCCGRGCVNLDKDVNNCGACNHRCPTGICISGNCPLTQ